jgi:hypothetical protein
MRKRWERVGAATLAAMLAAVACQAEDRATRVITDQSAVVMTATTTGTGWLADRYTEAIVYVDVTAESGTVTLDVEVQTSPDNAIWAAHPSGTFTQITAVTTGVKALTNLGQYVRLKYTIAGTTSMTLTSKIVLKN